MKVCIATTAFPRWQGDFRGIFVFEAARALVKMGCQVKVVAMHNPGSSQRETLDGIEVVRPPYFVQKWEILQRDSAGIPAAWKSNHWARLLLVPFLFTHAAALVREAKNCDLIHANWTLSAIAAWAGYPLHHKPFLVTVQGSDIYQAPRIFPVKILTRLALHGSRQIVALSNSLAKETSRVTGIGMDQIQVVPNGVNLASFPFAEPDQRQDLLLFVGSLIERKGVRQLIEAMPLVLQQFPGFHLVMIGEGPLKAELEMQIAQLGIKNEVHLIGTQPQTEISTWMRRARLFVLPSLEEGQGVVLVEALASGLPCVGTHAGGIPDVVTPDVGRLVTPGDSNQLARAICDILENQSQWVKLSRAARKRAENCYDWEQIGSRLLQIYRQVKE